MLAGVVGLEAVAGGSVLGLDGAFVLGVCTPEFVLGRFAPLPAAPAWIGICGVAVWFELSLGFTTAGVALLPFDPLQAPIASSPSAPNQVDAPRKYMIFLRMPDPLYARTGAATTENL
jgi:hypothetical protein